LGQKKVSGAGSAVLFFLSIFFCQSEISAQALGSYLNKKKEEERFYSGRKTNKFRH
jgi:hypothetical protein